MKRLGMVLMLVILAGSILAGCVIVPLDGYHGGRGSYRGHSGPYHYRGR
jgi:hypothetical protein